MQQSQHIVTYFDHYNDCDFIIYKLWTREERTWTGESEKPKFKYLPKV